MSETQAITPHSDPLHPGAVLRQYLDQRGWTITELADITGFARTHLSAVLSGKVGISADLAVAFAGAFGNTATEWLRWNAEHQLSLVSTDHAQIEQRAKLYASVPVREMQRRGWISDTRSGEELQNELTKFFGDDPLRVATLRSDPMAALAPPERAWCFRARQLAVKNGFVAEYDAARMPAAEQKLRRLAVYPKEAERLPEILAFYGIRFVVVEPLPSAKIDGAAFWVDGSPVIAVSARWDRIDAFWFTVMHEFMHIKNGDSHSVDVNLLRESDTGVIVVVSDDEIEQRASEQASAALVPKDEMDSFVRRTSPFYASTKIVQFAHRVKMHPGIIIGQLQHRGEIGYSSHRGFLVKIRKYVVDAAVTDGWGRTLSLATT